MARNSSIPRKWFNPSQKRPKVTSLLRESQRQELATEDDRGMSRKGK